MEAVADGALLPSFAYFMIKAASPFPLPCAPKDGEALQGEPLELAPLRGPLAVAARAREVLDREDEGSVVMADDSDPDFIFAVQPD